MAVTARVSCRGYSLLEVVMVMGVSALIVGGMALAIQSQEHAYRVQGSGGVELQNLDLAVRRLQKDLQLAGTGLPPRTLPAIVPGSGDGIPVLTIRYLADAPFVTHLTASATDDSKIFHIPPKDIDHFRQGDEVLVHHEGAWLAFQVAAVQSRASPGTSPGLRPAPEILGGARDQWFQAIFPQGSEVLRLRDAAVEYLLAGGEAWNGRLVRRQGTREEVVASGVHELSVEYNVAVPGHGYTASPKWILVPRGDAPVLETRVRLAVGRTAVRFTVAPRNFLRESLS